MRIRTAEDRDVPVITAIYNDAVENTTAIWNDATADEADRLRWLAAHREADHPVLVAVDEDDSVLGYATYGPWRDFDGYARTVEHSVYVHRDARGAGIGRALMEELIDAARARGMHVMVAGIEAGNTGSIRLHEKLGFTRAGLLPQVGRKFGRWLDLAFLQLIVD